jgi:hypothetical protein
MKANKPMKGQGIPNHRRRNGKKVKSSTDSTTHNQILKQQRQLHDRDHHILIDTNTAAYRRPTSSTEINTG